MFRPDANVKRMLMSSERASLPLFDPEELLKCIKRFVQVESDCIPSGELTSLYLRPFHIGTEPTLGVAPSSESILFVLASPSGPYFSTGIKPVSLLANPNFVRAWPGGPGYCKMGSNYAPTLHVQRIAEEKGHQQVLWLFGEDHQITEVGSMNVFVYLINESGQKELVTAPLDSGIILPGITRDSVLTATREWVRILVPLRLPPLLSHFSSDTAIFACFLRSSYSDE